MNFLRKVIQSDSLHAKWLNTLSYLENCGARKIAACEHPTQVKEEMLKHAAEEFRHALHLKRQIAKVSQEPLLDYAITLGGRATKHYLRKLELQTLRYLKEQNLPLSLAYYLVTYAIELRAQQLYPLYDQHLRVAGSKVTVKSILLEEQEHLSEMKEALERAQGLELASKIICFEEALYQQWLAELEGQISTCM